MSAFKLIYILSLNIFRDKSVLYIIFDVINEKILSSIHSIKSSL